MWCILVSLLMTPGTPVPNEILIDRLWGTEPPAKALEDLRAYVSRLGRYLRGAVDDDTRLIAQSHGYALVTDPQSVDVHRFRRLGRQADAMAQSGDEEHAAALLLRGDALWRGQALSGLAGDYLSRVRTGLEEERRASIVKRIELELRLGHHARLIGELSQLTGQYPVDETLAGQRMTALYRAGRQVDALQVYCEARDRLVDHGIEPGPALARLHQSVLRQDPELAITPAVKRPGPAGQPDTLPPDLGSFVGRAAELRAIQRSHGTSGPLVHVIEGMPGAGKTTVAVRAAHQMTARFPDARLFLDFHCHTPGQLPLRADQALHLLLVMLGTPAACIPGDAQERSRLWQAELACRRMIIVLDDVSGIEDVRPILPDGGDHLVIITSRRRLTGLSGATSQVLDVLPPGDATALFTQISGQTGAAGQVTHVVQLCGYLPLAIWMSASWLRNRDSAGLPDLLDELASLAREPQSAGSLDEQIMPTFAMSYRGLTESQQVLFRRLGASPCPEASVHAAQALAGQELGVTQQALRVLTDHHLLAELPDGRYRFHDIIHAYAARLAHADPESDRRDSAGRLLSHYLNTARTAARNIFTGGRREPVPPGDVDLASPVVATTRGAHEWLETEWNNAIRVAGFAARHEQKRQCADLIDTLTDFLERNGHWEEAVGAHRLALQASREVGDHRRAARAALAVSMVELLTGQQEAARNHADDAAELSRRLGDRSGEAAALDQVGVVCHQAARYRAALAYHQESCDIYRDLDVPRGMALALCHSGDVYAALGRLPDMVASYQQALGFYRRISDKRGEGLVLNNLGSAQKELGYHKDAMRNFEDSLHIFKELDEQQNVAVILHNMGIIYQYKGDHDQALPILRTALSIYRRLGDVRLQADIFCDIGAAYQDQEYYSEALAHHEKAQAIAQDIGERSVQIKAMCGIAEAQQGWGRHSTAFDAFRAAFELAREIESPDLEARALRGMGDTMLHTGGAETARIYLRQAFEIYRQMGVPEATILEIRLETMSASA